MFEFFSAIAHSFLLLIAYISSNNEFPKPLGAAEERMYLEKFREGDMAARNKLIEHNLRLVAHIAKKYSPSVRDGEELISIGTIGLIKGISSFDPSKGTRLATYAARCIENEILMLIRSRKKTQGDISLNESIGTDKEGNHILLIDVMSNDDEDVSSGIELKINVRRMYKYLYERLDSREREIIILRYGLNGGNPKTQQEIAEKLGISRSYVSRIEKRAVLKLRAALEEPQIQ